MKKIVVLAIIFVFLFTTFSVYAEEWPLGFPTANLKVEKAVPIGLLRKIALEEAKEVWGVVIPGPEIPCCDLEGNVVYYMFVFRIGDVPFETYGETMSEIKEGRRMRKEAAEKVKEYEPIPSVPRESMDDSLKKPKKEGITQGQIGSPIIPQPMEVPKAFRKSYEQFEIGKKKQWGIDKYGTLVISAREDFFPIVERIHGLPYYYTKGDLMQEKANEVLGGVLKITRIYFGGVLDQWVEFTGQGGKKVLISPFSLEIVSLDRVATLQQKRITRYRMDKGLIRNRWEHLRKKLRR